MVRSNLTKDQVSLEDRLFKSSLYLGLFGAVLLLIYDVFFTGDYYSVITESIALLFILYNFQILIRGKSSSKHRLIFSIGLLILTDFGWLSGGGISILLATLLFLVIEFILVVNGVKYLKVLLVILFLNYLVLFVLEYFFRFNLAVDYHYTKGGLIRQYFIWFLLFFFGSFFTVFLKVNYNKERENLSKANDSLRDKSIEITDQNEELIASKETLDKTIAKLDSQKKELIEIKNSLEDMVRERTNDLLSLNERLLSQNQQLEQYAYITSHNLRAPIAQIKGLVSLLPKDEKFNEITMETLGRLEDSTVRIEKVFADLSMILNVKNSMQKPWDEVDVINEVEEILDSLLPSIKEKNIKLVIPKNRTLIISALRPYVYSILHNLIENAVKYSDSKKVNSVIKVEFSETQKYQQVAVSDNGIGIDMEMASGKVFQMYQRFNNTHPGQGFGLFLVKSQMEAMEGKVELESVLGSGSTFRLYFLKRDSDVAE